VTTSDATRPEPAPATGAGGPLFVTGMQRSGTTLLARLLAAHPRVSLLSQPLPFLLLEAKRRFLRQLGEADPPLPFGPLFGERRYGPGELAEFLRRETFDAPTLRGIATEMEGFSGQYTRIDPQRLAALLANAPPRSLAATLIHLWRGLAEPPEATWYGGKETLAEELLPHLLAAGVRCLLVLRDPRDVLASLNHGRGGLHGGRPKPTLWNLRHWRKSIAFALHLASRAGFCWLRYEDLVEDPERILGEVGGELGCADLAEAALARPLMDGDGRPWRGNSSHREHFGVGRGSVGAWRGILPSAVVEITEASCGPELRALGYPVELPAERAPEVIERFVEPYPIERSALVGYGDEPAERRAERRRLELLADPGGEPLARWFLFPEVAARIAEGAAKR